MRSGSCRTTTPTSADRVVAEQLVHLDDVELFGTDLPTRVLLEVDRVLLDELEQLAVEIERAALVPDRLLEDLLDRVVVGLLDARDALLRMPPEPGQDLTGLLRVHEGLGSLFLEELHE